MRSSLRRLLPGRLDGGGAGSARDPDHHENVPTDPAVGEPIVRVEGLTKHFPAGGGLLGNLSLSVGGDGPLVSVDRESVRAVDDVTLDLRRGETLGLVGESGCGKSTLARTILRLLDPTAGRIYVKGRDVTDLGARDLRSMRADVQIVFQDARAALDPRMRIGPSIEEPMAAHGMADAAGREARARELLAAVGLDPQHYDRYPHALSGGQRQRVALARALSVNPDVLVLDEPVAALDVTIQAQVLETLAELQAAFDLTTLFIAHDLSVIRAICDRVAVMYQGRIVELADREELFENPAHPYTAALLASVPVPDPRASGEREVLQGEVSSPVDPPTGCRFHPRCPALIAPPDFDLDEATWDAVRTFVRAVDRREFDPADESAVRRRFFADVDVPGDAGEIVDAAIADVLADRWDAAADRLTAAFVEASRCARERPDYEIDAEYGDGEHRVACHLHRTESRTD